MKDAEIIEKICTLLKNGNINATCNRIDMEDTIFGHIELSFEILEALK